MPKRSDIKSILIIGAGPIVIGQACEFDYSGTQACRALKAEGYRIILVNSNPATIMTDPELADATYIEPITPEVVAAIIERERPDALLPTMGGQTALNTALSLARQGVLKRFGVEMIGATAEAIDKAEDRQLFREAMTRIGLATPKSMLANASALKRQDRAAHAAALAKIEALAEPAAETERRRSEYLRQGNAGTHERKKRYQEQALLKAMEGLSSIGLPAIIRPSFTLGGTGGASPTTARNFARSSSVACKPRPPRRFWWKRACSAGKSSRWRWCATGPTTALSSVPSRISIQWACTPATASRWPWR